MRGVELESTVLIMLPAHDTFLRRGSLTFELTVSNVDTHRSDVYKATGFFVKAPKSPKLMENRNNGRPRSRSS